MRKQKSPLIVIFLIIILSLIIFVLLLGGCSSVDCFKDIKPADYLSNHYQLINGKHLGIGFCEDIKDPAMYDLFEQFGFDGILGYPEYQISEELHQRFPNSMAAICGGNWKYYIDNFDYPYYYIDEWFEMSYEDESNRAGMPPLVDLIDYIRIHRPQSKFIIGGIRHILTDEYNPLIGLYYMYTEYAGDQSDKWIALRDKFGNHFFSSWMYGNSTTFLDGDEYCHLFEVANELQLNTIYLYIGDNKNPTEHLIQFILAAEKNGWIKKY